LERQSGKHFYSASHELIKDRDKLIVAEVSGKGEKNFTTADLSFEEFPYLPKMQIPHDKNTAWLDADKLELPLTVRFWQEGDRFVPLGMKGKKKVSDFFIDNKIPPHHKEKQLIILSGKDIVWLVGQRIDERYKTTPATKNVYQIRWNENLNG
jgi:tRNA(Ile)-lysidine synthase